MAVNYRSKKFYNIGPWAEFSTLNVCMHLYNQEILKGKVDLLFDWFGLACFANKNKN
jgi:hypothetical protein